MKRSSLLFSLLLFAYNALSQTNTVTVIDPNGVGGFESGTTLAANGWSTAGASSAVFWQCGTAGTVYSGSRSAFVGPDASTNSYAGTAARVCHMYRDVTIPSGATNVQLSWYLKGNNEYDDGEGIFSPSYYDYFAVYRNTTSQTPASNSLPAGTLLYRQVVPFTTFTKHTLILTGVAGTTFRLVFCWRNDGSDAFQPPATIDNISLTYDAACTQPNAFTGTASVCAGSTTTLSSSTPSGTWSTSNPAVATVSGGTITGVTPGVANITYTASGCPRIAAVTVNTTPTFNVTPATASVCSGVSTALTATPAATTGSITVSSPDIGLEITDGAAAGISHTLNVGGIPAGATITGVSVNMKIYHSWISDIAINLSAPNGNTLNLFNQLGSNGDNMLGTISSSASTAISAGSAPFSGTYLPSGTSGVGPTGFTSNVTAFSSLYSTPNGAWVLRIRDLGTPDLGILHTWSITINYTLPATTFAWTPTASLYTNSTLTTAYTGTNLSTVYAGISTATTFSATGTFSGCSRVKTSALSLLPNPNAITGTATVCQARTTTLATTTSGGTWSSASPLVASVSGSGTSVTVTGVNAGTAVISYILGSGCFTTRVVTVFAAPANITGPGQVCVNGTANLTHPDGGTGTWLSAHPSFATVNSASGVVSGVLAGLATISYTNTNGCVITRQVTVNPLPEVSISPATSAAVCLNDGQTFTAASPAPQTTLLSQNFNGTLADWTVVSTSGLAASHWQIVTPPGDATFAGDGTNYLQAASMLSPSPALATNTVITSPAFSTMGGFASVALSFNQVMYSFAPPDTKAAMEYSIDGGGSWLPLGTPFTGTLNSDNGDNGNWVASDPEVNIDLPAGALGQPDVRIRFVYAAQSLYWLIDNISIKGTMPAPTLAWTGPAGLSCTNCAAPTITPATVGTHLYNLAVTSSTGCITNVPVTVTANPLPAAISGNLLVCEGASNTLSSAPAGTWMSADETVATVSLTTGELAGVNAGTTTITYTLSSGCSTTAIATVLASPAAITPTASVAGICFGNGVPFSSTTPGGTWATSDAAVAPVTGTGSSVIVNGASLGLATITYTATNGCYALRNITVNPLPADIAGDAAVCVASTTTFTNTDALGTWSSDDISIASVNATTGEVLGVAQGNTYITYTLPTGCYKVKAIQVNPLPQATTGDNTLCLGNNTILFNTTGGGTWSSSATSVASVNTSGVVTAGSFPGAVDIYYTLTTTGCRYVHAMTVNPLPQAINGPSTVCKDATISLTNADPFGTWVSQNATVASVDAFGTLTGLAAGTSRISYTLPTGCRITTVITVNNLPNNISGANAVCYGATTNLLNTTAGGTWSTSDASVAVVNATGRVTPVAAVGGNATITYRITATGCYRTHDIVVNPLPAPLDSAVILCHEETTTLTNTVGGGTWASSNAAIVSIDANTGVATAAGVGFTNIAYTLPTGCRAITGVVVNQLPDDIQGERAVCIDAVTSLFSLTPSGTWSTSDAAVATVVGGDVTGLLAGTANISYTLATGCYKSVEVTVNALPQPITGNFAICVGSTSDLANADGGGVWSSSSLTASVSTTGVVTANSVGTATITYALPTGCIRTQVVTVNALPASITGTLSVCEGLTTDLNNTTPGGTWSSDNMAVGTVDPATGLVAGLEDGTTNISYTLATGCYRSRTVTVHVTPGPIGGTLSACLGQTSQLAGNPTNGTWSSGSASIASVNAAGLVTANGVGTAAITYTLPFGCRTTAVFETNALPASIGGSRVICHNATSTLTNASANGEWSSNDPAIAGIDVNSGLLSGNNPGVTSVTYTLLTTGCARSANVTVNALPSAITGNTAICVGSTATLATLSTGGTWSSSDPAIASISSTGVVTAHTAGNTNIAYTFSTGCRTTTAVTVNALPNAITGATAVCHGQQATALNTTAGGSWTMNDPAIGNIDANGIITGLSAGTTTITYTVDLTGCYTTRAFTVNALPAAITGNMGVCHGATTVLGNATSGGSWSSSNTAIATIGSSNGIASGLDVGFSIIQYTLPTGCSSNATIVVNPLPDPITGTNVLCVAGTTQLETTTMGGTWSSSSPLATVSSSGVVTGIAAGTATIYYTTGNGCRRARAVTVNALPGLITGTPTVCPGLTTTLGNSIAGGNWNIDDVSIATISSTGIVTPATTIGGTANVTYTLPTGCARSRQITVHPAVAATTGDAAVCNGSNITLANTTTGGVWSSSNTAVATVVAGTVTGHGAGVVDIAYTMPTGCKAIKQIVVNTLPGNITGAAAVCDNATVTLSNTVAGGSWTGSDDAIATISSTGVVTGVDAGTMTITYTLPTGCKTTRSMVVNALPAVKNVTGGGAYCAGGTGVAIGVDGSEVNTLYKLMQGTTPVLTVTGAGGVVDFGNQAAAGTYMVTAVTPQGCMQDMNGNAVITINPLIAPSVTMSSSTGSTVCAGTSVTFTATGVDGGTTPTYTWMVNGTDMGATATYTYVPLNGDIVSVKFISSETCAAPLDVTAQVTMTVNPNLTPAVTIDVIPGNKLCEGQTATYTATIANGGIAPTYTWTVDGTIVPGATNATYAYMPANGDLVVCKLTSSHACLTTNNVSSNGITMEIAPVFIPVVAVSADPGTTVQKGTQVTYTATVSNAGTAPAYQWLINSREIAGATNAIYTTSRLNDGDSVTCRVQGTGECSYASINSVVMEVIPVTGLGTTIISNSDVRLVPNPNNGTFTVSGTLATKADETVSFEVTNMLGQVIYKGATTAKAGTVEARIDLGSNLANGMYMLNMVVGAEHKAFHFVVKQ